MMTLAQVGDLVRKQSGKELGIVIKSKQHVLTPLTLLYVEWFNGEATWVSAMNLRRMS